MNTERMKNINKELELTSLSTQACNVVKSYISRTELKSIHDLQYDDIMEMLKFQGVGKVIGDELIDFFLQH